MSIDTLLEAARFLEWQTQQQITREESELREKVLHDREVEQRRTEAAPLVQPVRVNHVTWGEESRLEHQLTPVPPPPLPPPVPIAVIPIPVVPASPAALPPPTALSPPTAARLSPAGKDSHSPPQHQRPLLAQVKVEPSSPPHAGSPNLKPPQPLQPYPGSIVSAPQHALPPQPGLLQGPPAPAARPGALEDTRHLDSKRRPGGAGTREVHNKLEKNRRAHLKECFETLKRNIPNVDEKKTSNLSVLRSALRYIQTLKRKEKEYEHEMERLAREKIATQQRLAELKNELSQWMDVMEIDRVLRQTVQPEDDQASTSTASEGEDNFDQDVEEDMLPTAPSSLPKVPQALQPEIRQAPAAPAIMPSHVPLQHKPLSASVPAPAPAPAPVAAATALPAVIPAHSHVVTAPSIQPTVIAHASAAHASASHASVIQAVNHVIQAGPKHIAHIAPSSSNGPQPIGHITVHPVAHLPALYPQPVAVTQPAVVSHIAHTLSHAQVHGPAPSQQAATMVGKPATVGAQVVAHHPQLVGQTVLNPVTMVTMPSFPVSTLKLA
ncbi:max-binding protein MNT-like [Megalops cyprinoides]|uniref:max-binding protein MNT-like n=1 Tax=Megalops cyprinoides TaxID=118141 RepID=UPI001863A34E|nr:max-binding protein MNT-like [Megalops cyprinoides]